MATIFICRGCQRAKALREKSKSKYHKNTCKDCVKRVRLDAAREYPERKPIGDASPAWKNRSPRSNAHRDVLLGEVTGDLPLEDPFDDESGPDSIAGP